MWSQYWLDAKGWSGWHSLGDKLNPAAASRKSGAVEIFCRGLDNASPVNSPARSRFHLNPLRGPEPVDHLGGYLPEHGDLVGG
jgi:hypothetical protein